MLAFLGGLAVLFAPAVALAQTAAKKPDLWGHLPGALVIGVPLAIGLALYVSHRLGHKDASHDEPRRTGAVSRALERRGDED